MSVLTSVNLKYLQKKYDMISVGCDYLRCSFINSSDYIQEKIDLLDYDNSNYWIDDIGGFDFTFQKAPTPIWTSLTFSCSFNDVSVPCFQFVKFNNETFNITWKYWKLDFYWSFCRLVEIWFFPNSLFLDVKNKISEENPKITRYDFKIDFFSDKKLSIPDVNDILILHSQSNYDPHYVWFEITNRLVWSKSNWKYAIRFYDKLLDTNLKNKFFLYQDYFKFKSVHRLEFELQRNFLKWFTFYDFYDWLIFDHIKKVLGFDWFFDWQLFYEYDQSYIIQEKDRVKYLKRFDTSCIRLSKNKINPLIQCFMSLYEWLDDEDFDNQLFEFITFVEKFNKKLKYYDMRKELLNKFTS